MFTIEYLCDHSEFSGQVSRWLYDNFVHKVNKDLQYSEFHSFFEINSKNDLPIRLVAVTDGKCIGTITLIENDLSVRDYKPWLGGLYVDVQYRKHNIGRKLIESAKKIAKELGYSKIYLATENTGQYYQMLGWTYIETCVDKFGQTVEVYKTLL